MTDYTTITDSQCDPDAPLTSGLAYAWRDNPVAMGEKDTTVPLNLRLGHWVLGTLATTSGSTQTLSGLDLTHYAQIAAVFDGVSGTASTYSILLGGGLVASYASSGAALTYSGLIIVDLIGGRGIPVPLTIAQYAITNASTSISVSISAGSFDAGSVTIYGVR